MMESKDYDQDEEEKTLEEKVSLGIRRTSDDKLAYKFIIADAINECRRTMGTFDFPIRVKSLIYTVYFDIRGYSLKTQIEKILDDMGEETRLRDEDYEKQPIEIREKRVNRVKYKINTTRWFWEAVYQRMIQLLASENLLFDVEKVIPFKDIPQV